MNLNIQLTESQAAALQYVVDKANAGQPSELQLTPEQYLQARVEALCASYAQVKVDDIRAENVGLIEAVLAAPEEVRTQAKLYLQGLLSPQ